MKYTVAIINQYDDVEEWPEFDTLREAMIYMERFNNDPKRTEDLLRATLNHDFTNTY